ncbi:hypothetical protein FB45DRAFT_1118209 [Roridomyces roridus]|uniref:Zn(2)-C6 fungal-type domain-containing protein n=1 Tax=Roridomyces roridus TaxID=1738132 RepID=A0AAD7FAL1_9AGAR|nr:hypothetical protein FB45DRAFT_1118209 [Roridomyces roridus]
MPGLPSKPPSNMNSKRRRNILACLHCRQRKQRCITTEQPPRNACGHCTRKRLCCQYLSVAVAAEREGECEWSSSPSSPSSASQTRTPSPIQSISHSAAVLPYTGPPPAGSRPRYYDRPFPPLIDVVKPAFLSSDLTIACVDPRDLVLPNASELQWFPDFAKDDSELKVYTMIQSV